MCNDDITFHEINLCISKRTDNKSPGNGGLTCEFYKVFQEDVSEFLLQVFEEGIELDHCLKLGLKASFL